MARETVIIGSVTYAMKAKKALTEAGVRARLIKAAPRQNRGCTYGLEIDGEDRLSAIAELRRIGVSYEFQSNTPE